MQKGPWGTELFVTTARRQYRQFVSFHSASLHHLYPPNYRTFLQPHRYKAVKQRLEATNLKSSGSRDMLFTTSALILVALTSQVTAHGYVPQIKIGNNYYPGWNVNVRANYEQIAIRSAFDAPCQLDRSIYQSTSYANCPKNQE
ncbi:hypothetical protein FRC03_010164 [Tulasnella sp. 419]|nr:hypothetical protein FRC03_010164 [Tulasnella sp. 419]